MSLLHNTGLFRPQRLEKSEKGHEGLKGQIKDQTQGKIIF